MSVSTDLLGRSGAALILFIVEAKVEADLMLDKQFRQRRELLPSACRRSEATFLNYLALSRLGLLFGQYCAKTCFVKPVSGSVISISALDTPS